MSAERNEDEIQRRADAFQRAEISKLDAAIAACDVEIGGLQEQVATLYNVFTGARGVLMQRGSERQHEQEHAQAARALADAKPFSRAQVAASFRYLEQTRKKDRDVVPQRHRDDRQAEAPQQTPHHELAASYAPCATVLTPFRKRFEAPRQAFQAHANDAKAELHFFAHALTANDRCFLRQLAYGEHVWLVYWLDRNRAWREFVRPPRRKHTRVGVFASRAPNRPTPVGISLAQVLRYEESDTACILQVLGTDILNSTPLLALRSYERRDFHIGARCGWVDDNANMQSLYYDVADGSDIHHQSSSRSSSSSGASAAGDDGDKMRKPCEYRVLPLAVHVNEQLDFVNAQMGTVVDTRAMIENILLYRDPARLGKPFRSESVSLSFQGRALIDCGAESEQKLSASETQPYSLRVVPLAAYRVVLQLNHASRTCIETPSVAVRCVISGIRRDVMQSDAHVDPEIQLHLLFLRRFFPALYEDVTGSRLGE
ncbi:putative S-adenosyl-L-methionine-binding protein [Porphyridium purpureum]|uniref:Putative S-adenosyl-L-methionine-binding protein n=1 Tax=Porphyridium purpureum TaxID=35688 RepID=A0A5J4Z7X0_PORPP|nr:putative S-adenosyl-L-methionine-binding protein [Porphyridium purpureum]|eukprot:POR2967..scf295_1